MFISPINSVIVDNTLFYGRCKVGFKSGNLSNLSIDGFSMRNSIYNIANHKENVSMIMVDDGGSKKWRINNVIIDGMQFMNLNKNYKYIVRTTSFEKKLKLYT